MSGIIGQRAPILRCPLHMNNKAIFTAERKAFIRLFIKKIIIDYPTVTIEYTITINSENKLDKEVLVINSVS